MTITVTLNSQNIANNTSNVTVKMTAQSDSTSYHAYNFSAVNPVKLVVDGSTKVDTKIAIDLSDMEVVTLATWTGNITHSTDGSKTLSCTGNFYVAETSSLGSAYADDAKLTTSTSLPKIARASSISSISSSTNTIGETFTMKISVQNTTFTHKTYIKIGSTTVVSSTNISAGTTSKTFSSPASTWAAAIPNATSATATVYLDTYNGSTKIGSASKTFTVKVPSSAVPSISSVTITDSAGYLGTYGGYIQGKSKPSVKITAAGIYGSTLSSFSVQIDGKTYTKNTSISPCTITCSPILSSTTPITATITVKDSRGRSKSTTSSLVVLPYSNPSISNFSVQRCNSDGTVNDNGSCLKASCNYIVYPLLNGSTIQNSATLKCYYKTSSASSYSSGGSNTLTLSSTVTSQSSSFTITSTNTDTSYFVYLEISDALASTTTKEQAIGTTYVLLHLSDDGSGMSIGKAAELSDMFDVGLESLFRKKITLYSALSISHESTEPRIDFLRSDKGCSAKIYLQNASTGSLAFATSSSSDNSSLIYITKINEDGILPYTSNTFNLGSSSYAWNNIYGKTLYENGTALNSKYNPIVSVTNRNANSIADKNVATANNTNLGSFTLAAGTWVIFIHVYFSSNTNGRRAVWLATSSTGSSMEGQTQDNRAPVNGAGTTCKIQAVFTPTASTTYYVNCYQNSGSTLSVSTRYTTIKLK